MRNLRNIWKSMDSSCFVLYLFVTLLRSLPTSLTFHLWKPQPKIALMWNKLFFAWHKISRRRVQRNQRTNSVFTLLLSRCTVLYVLTLCLCFFSRYILLLSLYVRSLLATMLLHCLSFPDGIRSVK